MCAGTLDCSFANVPPHETEIVAAGGLGTRIDEYCLDLSGYGFPGAVLFFLQCVGAWSLSIRNPPRSCSSVRFAEQTEA
jgi:hypothetical protein